MGTRVRGWPGAPESRRVRQDHTRRDEGGRTGVGPGAWGLGPVGGPPPTSGASGPRRSTEGPPAAHRRSPRRPSPTGTLPLPHPDSLGPTRVDKCGPDPDRLPYPQGRGRGGSAGETHPSDPYTGRAVPGPLEGESASGGLGRDLDGCVPTRPPAGPWRSKGVRGLTEDPPRNPVGSNVYPSDTRVYQSNGGFRTFKSPRSRPGLGSRRTP